MEEHALLFKIDVLNVNHLQCSPRRKCLRMLIYVPD